MCICNRNDYRFDYTNSVHDVIHVFVNAKRLAVMRLAIVKGTMRGGGTNALNPTLDMRSRVDKMGRGVNTHPPLGELNRNYSSSSNCNANTICDRLGVCFRRVGISLKTILLSRIIGLQYIPPHLQGGFFPSCAGPQGLSSNHRVLDTILCEKQPALQAVLCIWLHTVLYAGWLV